MDSIDNEDPLAHDDPLTGMTVQSVTAAAEELAAIDAWVETVLAMQKQMNETVSQLLALARIGALPGTRDH